MKRREPAVLRAKKHPAAVAWEKFEQANPDLFDRSTIGHTDVYLRNRIQHAFMDGWDACSAHNGEGNGK